MLAHVDALDLGASGAREGRDGQPPRAVPWKLIPEQDKLRFGEELRTRRVHVPHSRDQPTGFDAHATGFVCDHETAAQGNDLFVDRARVRAFGPTRPYIVLNVLASERCEVQILAEKAKDVPCFLLVHADGGGP